MTININFPPLESKNFLDLKNRINEPDDFNVIKKALALLDVCLDIQLTGGKIVIHANDGSKEKLPNLKTL